MASTQCLHELSWCVNLCFLRLFLYLQRLKIWYFLSYFSHSINSINKVSFCVRICGMVSKRLDCRQFWVGQLFSDIHSKTACPEFESLCPCQSALPTSKPECSFAFGFCLFHTGVDLVHLLRQKPWNRSVSGLFSAIRCTVRFATLEDAKTSPSGRFTTARISSIMRGIWKRKWLLHSLSICRAMLYKWEKKRARKRWSL